MNPKAIYMNFAIIDDNGFVHNGLTEPETLTAFVLLTNPENLKQMDPGEFENHKKRYFKKTIGQLHLVRIIATRTI